MKKNSWKDVFPKLSKVLKHIVILKILLETTKRKM